MHKILGYTNNSNLDGGSNNWHTSSSKPWSYSTVENTVILDVLGARKSNLFQPKHMDGSVYIRDHKANNCQSDKDLLCERIDDAEKEIRITAISQSDGNHEEKQDSKIDKSVSPSTIGTCVAPAIHLELGCTSFPFFDPLYGGAHPSFGPQMQPFWFGMHNGRMVLPLDTAEEPVYVNAKQYHGILRRRQSRAKAEVGRKLIKDRKPYLHESRHLHAMRRARGSGGRFLNTKKLESNPEAAPDKSISSGDPCPKYSGHLSSHGPVTSQFDRNVNSMTSKGKVTESTFSLMPCQRTYTSSSGFPGFQPSGQHTFSDERVAGGNNNLKGWW